jgi:predicted Fe-Mo cluster-binding NifX family protein/acyl-coenzyme A thioesterase PaaI-like protein
MRRSSPASRQDFVRQPPAATLLLPLRAQSQAACIVCGPNHPHGLRIRYEAAGDGSVAANWIPTPGWEGFRGIVHGGIISAVLDEAMAKAVAATHSEALTGELRVRFRHHVQTGKEFRIRGWVVKRAKRLIETEATLTAAGGSEHAHAWASFLVLVKPQRWRAAARVKSQTDERVSMEKERNKMTIAVPTNDGTSISAHFGRSAAFLIFETENGQIKSRELKTNGAKHAQAQGTCAHHSAGSQPPSHAGILAALAGCEVVICAGMGSRAAEALKAGGVTQIVVTAPGSAEEAVTAYLAGKLTTKEAAFCRCSH